MKTERSLTSTLEIASAVVNLTFHDIVPKDAPRGRYDVSESSFWEIVEWSLVIGLAPHIRIYFDDNYESFHSKILPRLETGRFADVIAAVPISSIGEPGRAGWDQLQDAELHGVRIVPHGFSHVRLASYSNGILLPTPLGGKYRNRPDELDGPLAENEVLYQLVEAHDVIPAQEFVLPYGCYNRATIECNARLGLYDWLATADFDFDRGQHLRPRLLVERGLDSPEELCQRILKRGAAA